MHETKRYTWYRNSKWVNNTVLVLSIPHSKLPIRTLIYIFFNLFVHVSDNIALYRPAYQQYQYPGVPGNLTEASNGVDGLKSNLDFPGGQCFISENNRQNATWWVNLTRILSIHHITIYFRTGNTEWGMFLDMFKKKETKTKQNTVGPMFDNG